MIRVKLKESYKQAYWDSATGVTLSKGDVVPVDEDSSVIRHAINTGILEVVTEKQDEINIITDVPTTETIAEIVTQKRVDENKRVINNLREKADADKSTDKADKLPGLR